MKTPNVPTKARILLVALSIALLLAALAATAFARSNAGAAAVPATMSYQGHLLDDTGDPVDDGTYAMTFSLWDNPTVGSGTQLWGPEAHGSVQTTDGYFTVLLGETAPLDASALSSPLYLQIEVGSETLEPRQAVGPVPFALVASTASTATYASEAGAVTWTGVSGKPSTYPPSSHDHDDRYYTESEANTLLGGKANAVHTHDDRYYTEAESDTRYVNEGQGSSVSPAMLQDGTTLAEILDDDGAGSGLDADLLDAQHGDYYRNADNINAGTLATGRYSAYDDLSAEGYLNNDGGGDLLTQAQADGRYARKYANVVVVAKSGGDYTTVQAAIDSIGDASASNPYLVWVAPGVYIETVRMKPYVHLQGAGEGATVISSTASTSPGVTGTLEMASYTSLRDLSVKNTGNSGNSAGILAGTGTTATLISDVAVHILGAGNNNYGVYLTGSGTSITLQDVTILAADGSYAHALFITADAKATVYRGFFHVVEAGFAIGIYNQDGGTLEATDPTVLAEGADACGVYNYGHTSSAILLGGTFTARASVGAAQGLQNGALLALGQAQLEAHDVMVLAEGKTRGEGLRNVNSAATVRGGSFTGRCAASGDSRGISCTGSTAVLDAEEIRALGEGSSTANYGLLVAGTVNVMSSVLEGSTNSVKEFASGSFITLAHTRLVGGAVSGSVTCVAVSRGTSFGATSCP